MSSTSNFNLYGVKISNVKLSDANVNNLDSGSKDFNPFSVPGPRTEIQEIEESAMDSPLLKLPPELRLPIYGPLIAAGDLNILRTNKLIHMEATDVLKSTAILRMNFGSNWTRQLPSRAAFPLTGSLDLMGTLKYHAPADIQRIECHYWLDFNSVKPHSFDK